jgi:Rap1a immunity proteins
MKRLNYLICAIVASLGLGLPAFGAGDPPQRRYQSEEQLRFFCTPQTKGESDAEMARAICQSYVVGVVDGHEAATGINKGALRVFCLPEGTLNVQLTDAVITWLKAHPPAVQSGAFAIFSGLHDQFPCAGERRRKGK